VAALLKTRCVMDMIIAVITAMKIYSSASRTVSQMVFHGEPSIGIPQSANVSVTVVFDCIPQP